MQPIAQKIKDYLESLGFIKTKTQVDISYKLKEGENAVFIDEQGNVYATVVIKGPVHYE